MSRPTSKHELMQSRLRLFCGQGHSSSGTTRTRACTQHSPGQHAAPAAALTRRRSSPPRRSVWVEVPPAAARATSPPERPTAPSTARPSTKRDAQAWEAEQRADRARGRWIDPSAGRVPLRTYADEWMRTRRLAPRMQEVYASQLKHIIEAFGDAPLNAITRRAVRLWHADVTLRVSCRRRRSATGA